MAPHFEKGEQEDAHEFLVLWLQALKAQIINLMLINTWLVLYLNPYCLATSFMPFRLQEAGCPSTNGKPALLEASGMTPNYMYTSASFILTLTEVFGGQYCSSVTCLKCEHVSSKIDLFSQLEAYQSE